MRAQFGDQDSFGDQVVSGDPRLILSLATPSSANSFHRIVQGGAASAPTLKSTFQQVGR